MLIVKEISELEAFIQKEKKEGKKIGLVPTMGALHEGHLSLVKKAGEDSDCVVVSIFVNPTQFNDPNDLKKYPRKVDQDIKLLETSSCKIVFIPEVKTMYPEPDTRHFDFGRLGEIMEGAYRKGHFNGVAQIVSKLFSIVKPDIAFFGMKDFQQIAIIRSMVKQLKLPVEIVSCPVVRESDGLAKSSRNVRLSKEQRENAPWIYKVLKEARDKVSTMTVPELKSWVESEINKNSYLKTQYFEIVESKTLMPVESWDQTNDRTGCVAVFCGDIRLIDEITL